MPARSRSNEYQAEARTALIAELGLDMVEVQRQLAVRLDFGAHHVGDHFLGRRLDRVVAAVAVFHAHQFRAHLVPAPGFLPQLGRLHQRHQQLDRAGLVHLVTDDRLDLADHPQARRHISVDAGSEALDHARAHHQLVADDLGVGRRFFLGRNKKSGGTHIDEFFLKRESYNQPNFKGLAGRCVQSLYKWVRMCGSRRFRTSKTWRGRTLPVGFVGKNRRSTRWQKVSR
jgi:hypothetical protein